ncbi:MAG: ABC transporter ATP-binding protein [Acidobacteria bacterium]|nr:ABC transporter ATP-binding protein [Acidobacteriota bacterium]
MKTSKRNTRLFRRLIPTLRKHTMLATLAVLLMILVDIAGVVKPWLVKIGIDRYVRNGDIPGLTRIGIILAAILIAGFLFQVVFIITVQYLGQRLLFDLRMDLFRKLMRLPASYFDKTPLGKTLTHITSDVEAIREFISDGIVTVAGDVLKILFIASAMVMLSPRLALAAFITLPFFVVATGLFRKSIRTGFREVRKANSDINTVLTETIGGAREIQLFQTKGERSSIFEICNRHYLLAYLKVIQAYALYFPVLEIVSNGGMILILVTAHFFMGTALEPGVIFAFFAYINMFFFPLRQMAEKFNLFQSAMAASERVFHMLDQPEDISNPEGACVLPENGKMEIRFQNVTFGYDPTQPVLKNVTFNINAGERVAFVGATGSGKTTVIKLINRLYDIQEGTILVNGIDISQLSAVELRKRIATIPQNPFLFTGTISDNISLHRSGVTDKDVRLAAEKSRARQFIEHLPHRYGEKVLESGKRLSAGQRQLLAFTRALTGKPELVILDEATANIDSETEHLIEHAVEEITHNRTAIIIAHRLSTIRKVDRIFVFRKGKLVESGTHTELLQQNGLYVRFLPDGKCK